MLKKIIRIFCITTVLIHPALSMENTDEEINHRCIFKSVGKDFNNKEILFSSVLEFESTNKNGKKNEYIIESIKLTLYYIQNTNDEKRKFDENETKELYNSSENVKIIFSDAKKMLNLWEKGGDKAIRLKLPKELICETITRGKHTSRDIERENRPTAKAENSTPAPNYDRITNLSRFNTALSQEEERQLKLAIDNYHLTFGEQTDKDFRSNSNGK